MISLFREAEKKAKSLESKEINQNRNAVREISYRKQRQKMNEYFVVPMSFIILFNKTIVK